MTVDTKFRKLLAWLRREFPTSHQVRVRRVDLRRRRDCGKLGGYAEFCVDHFRVWIHRNTCWQLQRETLFEEWAHCLLWHAEDYCRTVFDDKDDNPHTVLYSATRDKITKEFLDWRYGAGPEANDGEDD